MFKSWNKLLRRTHRRLGMVTALTVFFILAMRNSPYALAAQQVLQALGLVMVVTGIYLFVLPWWMRWHRRRRLQ